MLEAFVPVQLERQLRLTTARYKELQHALDCVKAQMRAAGSRQEGLDETAGEQTKSGVMAGDATAQEQIVPVPQPAEDRSLTLLPLLDCILSIKPASLSRTEALGRVPGRGCARVVNGCCMLEASVATALTITPVTASTSA